MSKPSCPRKRVEPHPPCPRIQSCRSVFQPSAAFVTHGVDNSLRARVPAIAGGSEDADDLDHLRTDPAGAVGAGRRRMSKFSDQLTGRRSSELGRERSARPNIGNGGFSPQHPRHLPFRSRPASASSSYPKGARFGSDSTIGAAPACYGSTGWNPVLRTRRRGHKPEIAMQSRGTIVCNRFRPDGATEPDPGREECDAARPARASCRAGPPRQNRAKGGTVRAQATGVDNKRLLCFIGQKIAVVADAEAELDDLAEISVPLALIALHLGDPLTNAVPLSVGDRGQDREHQLTNPIACHDRPSR